MSNDRIDDRGSVTTGRSRDNADGPGQVTPGEGQVFTFGGLRLDTGTRELSGPDGCRELPELTFSVLLTLIRHSPNVVTLEEFTSEAWGRGFVSPENLVQRIKLLRQELGDDGKHPQLVKAVRGRGYRLAAEVQVENRVAPSNDVADRKHVGRAQTHSSRTHRLLNRILAILAVLAIATIYLVLDRSLLEPARNTADTREMSRGIPGDSVDGVDERPAIAVLPFVNLSDDPAQDYFSDGMAEEILNLLSQVPGLRVISRTSSFAFGNEDLDIPRIAEQLNVDHVIEGSVRKSGDRIRVTAQLIDANQDAHVWSQTFERPMSDVFTLQDEISAAIVERLRSSTELSLAFTPIHHCPKTAEAGEAFLRGKHLMKSREAVELKRAAEAFAEVVELEPDCARGHVQLAISMGLHLVYAGIDDAERRAQVSAHARRAIELDPELAEAHLLMGAGKQMPGELDEKITYYKSAIERNPNLALAHLWLSNNYRLTSRWNEALESARKAASLDPLSSPAISNLYFDYARRDRREEAGKQLDKLYSLNPDWASELHAHFVSLDGDWSKGAIESLKGIQAGFMSAADEFFIFLAMMGLLEKSALNLAAMGLSDEAEANLGSVHGGLLFHLYYAGRPRALVSALEETRTDQHRDFETNVIYGLSLAGSGDYSGARPVLDAIWSSVPGLSGLDAMEAEFVLAYNRARRETGGPEIRQALLEALREDIEADKKGGLVGCDWWLGCPEFKRGFAEYLGGDREAGLALIEASVDQGYFIVTNLDFLEFLYQDPGFAPIMEKQQARQKAEREKFLDVVCVGNPYADAWQPSESVCESYLAQREY